MKLLKTLLVCLFFAFPIIANAQYSEPKPEAKTVKIDGYQAYQHQRNAMMVLGAWGGGSIGVGAVQMFSKNLVTKNFGLQNIIWGAVDLGLATYGIHNMEKKIDRNEWDPAKERLEFRKILFINTLLDVLYMVTGYLLIRTSKDKFVGHGYGIATQGAFLFLFDGINVIITL